jgi:DNA-binding NtrC family response regulator
MRTILFIDDSESHRFLLQEEFMEDGYEVVTAKNNDEVLLKYGEVKPDLIILELRQKNIKEETFQDLRRQYPNIPWIGYSTFNQCPDEFRQWINFYLPKSVDTSNIKELVRGL